jgi:hypothetical protein
MCNCPTDQELFESIDRQIDANHWLLMAVGYTEDDVGGPRWIYTIGLAENFGHPELVLVGDFCAGCASETVNALAGRIAAGERWTVPTDAPITLDDGLVHLRPVPDECWATDWFAAWKHYYAVKPYEPPPAEALHVVIADGHGRFPWEPGSDAELALTQQLPAAPRRSRPNRAARRRAPRHRR